MKFLIIDDDNTIRVLLKKQVQRRWPEAEVDVYDPIKSGIPHNQFPWSSYDIVLLDYDLGLAHQTGIDLLPRIKRAERMPVVIMVTGQGNENIAVKAIRAGADDYLIKYDVVTDRLFEVISEALTIRASVDSLTRQAERQEQSPDQPAEGSGRQGTDYLPEWDIPGYGCLAQIARNLSVTLRAERLEDRRPVILKVLKIREMQNSPALKRFNQELNILSSLNHPNVIGILDHGTTADYAYYAMEYLELGDLAKALEQGPLQPAAAVSYASQIASGLEALHERQIIHRDIKPQNILFRDHQRVVIADLGVAKDLTTEAGFTAHGEVLGTPFYMSPEQFTGKPVDQRSDIYSLGVVLYEMLAGYRPFSGDNIMEVVYKHTYESPPPLPPPVAEYQDLLKRMLAKAPANRYRSLREFKDALDEITH